MDTEEYFQRYDAWKKEAHEEACNIFKLASPDEVEVTELGQVQVKSVFHCTEIGTVTPWKESSHYITGMDQSVSHAT